MRTFDSEPAGGVRLGQRTVTLRRRSDRVKLADVSWMCDKLATMQSAGLPLFQAVSTLARMKAGTPLGRRLAAIAADVGEGTSFATAVRRFESDFEPLTCALIETGETTGHLADALDRAAHLIDTRLRLRRKVRSAMTYPTVVLVVTSLLIAALLVFIVPQFEEIYSEAGGELPALTQALVTASKFLPAIIATLFAAGIGFVVAYRHPSTSARTRKAVARAVNRIPLIGSLAAKAADARVASTLASLMSAGVPLLDALTLAARTANDDRLSAALIEVRTSVDDGASFTEAMVATGAFPEMLTQLAAVGEESGSLPSMMDRYANIAEAEVVSASEAITSTIEPLLMVIVGSVVGVFLIGLYLPMISIGDQIK